ncbi:Transcription elongation factor spt6 [Tilletia horrida]|uniref:Transcription elongation factor SPT6 n=1 Tax=Tilletia horrida TaxID=155126 RepID=A0AAN6GLM8_9BASI|nr:Transcription elongation factor spt6 [Tilletia horrida]KAK0563025.1 Transcription elongation factor spt6 [Tilletia horrida]
MPNSDDGQPGLPNSFPDDEEGGEEAERGARVDVEGEDEDMEGEETGFQQDSSDEDEEDDPEEEAKIREGFIVDEDEEEDEEGRGRKKRRRKTKKRKQAEEEEGLDDDDLELLAENAGESQRRFKRFRQASASPTAGADLSRIFDDDEEDEELPSAAALNSRQIAANARRKQAARAAAVAEEDDMDDFIEDDFSEDSGDEVNDADRERRAAEKREERKRKKAAGGGGANFASVGIDQEAWDELFEVFGDGQDYAFALPRSNEDGEGGEEEEEEEEWEEVVDEAGETQLRKVAKKQVNLRDIFEPAQIEARMLTDADDRIKRNDIPERMQAALPGLDGIQLLTRSLTESELNEAAFYLYGDISPRTVANFTRQNAPFGSLMESFLRAVQAMLRYIYSPHYEEAVQLYHNRLDELVTDAPASIKLLDLKDLHSLVAKALKYKGLLARKDNLRATISHIEAVGPETDDAQNGDPSGDAADALRKNERDLVYGMLREARTIEEVTDLADWLMMRYGIYMRGAQAQRRRDAEPLEGLDDDLETGLSLADRSSSGFKRPTLVSTYERLKFGHHAELAAQVAISADDLVDNFTSGERRHVQEAEPTAPDEVLYEHYIANRGPEEEANDERNGLEEQDLLHKQTRYIKLLLSHEIGKQPKLKRHVRDLFKRYGVVSVEPTEVGTSRIEMHHSYYNFKYLKNKPIPEFTRTHKEEVPAASEGEHVKDPPLIGQVQYLLMLEAESKLLVKIDISLPSQEVSDFTKKLAFFWNSEGNSEVAQKWNELRTDIIQTAVEDILLPMGRTWVKDQLADECREWLGQACEDAVYNRINQAPYQSESMKAAKSFRMDDEDDDDDNADTHDAQHASKRGVPKVLAMTQPTSRAPISGVLLDQSGQLREYVNYKHLNPPAMMAEELSAVERRKLETMDDPLKTFKDFLLRHKPHVIVVAGWGVHINPLAKKLAAIANEVQVEIVRDDGETYGVDESRYGFDPTYFVNPEHDRTALAKIDTITVHDDLARRFRTSERAAQEFPGLDSIGRYCVGLARYAQSPLNEFAALGSDLADIEVHPHQGLLESDQRQFYMERALVSVVNAVGVNLNRAVRSPYYRHLLQYVAGLGPRKASALVSYVNSNMGGTVPGRKALIEIGEEKEAALPFCVYLNAASFLYWERDEIGYESESRHDRGPNMYDALDCTRIHPDDYIYPRKMAADALGVDAEELEGVDASQPCQDLMDDPQGKAMLKALDLENYANMLKEARNERKLLCLHKCFKELLKPYAEERPPFVIPSDWQVFTAITGLTRKAFDIELNVPVTVRKVVDRGLAEQGHGGLIVTHESGLEGRIYAPYIIPDYNNLEHPPKLRDLYRPGQVINAMILRVGVGDMTMELSARPDHIQSGDSQKRAVNTDPVYFDQARADDEAKEAAARRNVNRTKSQLRMIKHPNFHNFRAGQAEEHLATQPRGSCVVRPSSKGVNHLALTWKVDDGIYQHVDVEEFEKPDDFSIGRKLKVGSLEFTDLDEMIVEYVLPMARMVEMMMNHDKYKGSDEELQRFLNNQTLANPTRSTYAFGIDAKRPGYFKLSYKMGRDAPIQTWPVKVEPGSFQLNQAHLSDVNEVCNAFKTQHTAQAVAKTGGRTPAPASTHGRTPAPNYGYGTPRVPGMGMMTPRHLGSVNPYGGMGGATPRPVYGVAAGGSSVRGFGTPVAVGVMGGARTPGHVTTYGGPGNYQGMGAGSMPGIPSAAGGFPGGGRMGAPGPPPALPPQMGGGGWGGPPGGRGMPPSQPPGFNAMAPPPGPPPQRQPPAQAPPGIHPDRLRQMQL